MTVGMNRTFGSVATGPPALAGRGDIAGETLMERASPDGFDRMVRLYNACGERPIATCEAALAAGTAAKLREVPPRR